MTEALRQASLKLKKKAEARRLFERAGFVLVGERRKAACGFFVTRKS